MDKEQAEKLLMDGDLNGFIKAMEEVAKSCPHPADKQLTVIPRSGKGNRTCTACWKSWPMSNEEMDAEAEKIRKSLGGK